MLLKLGGYGLLGVYIVLIIVGIKFVLIWFYIRVVGGTLVRLIYMRQTDLKYFIAYS